MYLPFADCRKPLLESILQQVATLLHKGMQVETCFNVISDVMDFLYTNVNNNREYPFGIPLFI